MNEASRRQNLAAKPAAHNATDAERDEREPPTLPDFRASLPSITWTYADV